MLKKFCQMNEQINEENSDLIKLMWDTIKQSNNYSERLSITISK